MSLLAPMRGSIAPTVLQGGITGGGLGAVVVTFVLVSVFYAVTLHLAATFFIGDIESQKAAYVGPVPAVVSILLGQYGVQSVGALSAELGVLVVLLMTLIADALAIRRVYDLANGPTAVLTALHVAFAVVLGFALNNLFGLI